jgi:hypothetical protein
MGATRLDTGQIEVDPVELFRVFPPIAAQEAQSGAVHHDGADDNVLHVSALETEVRLLREMLDAMSEDRNAWRELPGRRRSP